MTVSTRSVAVTPSFSSAGQTKADNLRQKHGDRLTEHRRLGFDATDAPAEHAESIDHRGVQVGAYARVREGDDVPVLARMRPDRLRQIFEVDLMANAGTGRHDAEIAECLLAPLQKPVALLVALVFEFDIAGKCHRCPELIHDDGMVDDEVDRNERIDLLRIAAKRGHRVSHSCQIDHCRNAGEVLHEDAGRAVGYLDSSLALVSEPACNCLDAFLRDRASIFIAEQVLQQNLHRIRQLGNAGETVLFGLDKTVINVLRVAYLQYAAAIETVE